MATPTRKAILMATVRTDATNNSVRAKINGVTSTYTLTAGSRYFGLNGNSAPTDGTLFGSTSFIKHFNTIVGFSPRVFHGNSPAGITATTTYGGTGGAGHIALDPVLATDQILWGDAATTMDPSWFGRQPAAGSYATWSATGTGIEDGSQMCSSCVFIGDVQIRDDRHIETIRQQQTRADNGKIHTVYYGRSASRWLEFRIGGVPREDFDSSYHALRRFLATIQTGMPFVYLPDISVTGNPTTFDVDAAAENERYGWQVFVMSPRNETIQWDDAPLFPGYAQHWIKGFYVDEAVPP